MGRWEGPQAPGRKVKRQRRKEGKRGEKKGKQTKDSSVPTKPPLSFTKTLTKESLNAWLCIDSGSCAKLLK